MANLTTHYKEREPNETIKIIQDFFNNNFTIRQTMLEQSEADTWYCRIELFQDSIYLLGANGKGMTEEYALASCYAELYERFCNRTNFLANPCWVKAFMESNKKNNGYYFSPNERLLTYEELINAPRVNNYFTKLADNNPELVKESISIITDDIYVGVPMKNIANQEVLYMDPRILRRIERTNGMCAGNTLNEALVQGCSEILERLVSNSVIFNKDMIKYYSLNLNNITNPNLQHIIKKIQDAGYDLYIFDLSYSYQMPVLMSLIIDRNTGILKADFGSFPVFDIAAERVLTELYQGVYSIRNNEFICDLQIPYKIASDDMILEENKTTISGKLMPNVFNNIEYVDTYNTNVFVNSDTTNDQLLNYYCGLGNRLCIKFYYMNNSLIDDMYALHVFAVSDNTKYIHAPMYFCDFTTNDTEKDMCFYSLKTLKQFYKNLYENKPINLPEFIRFIEIHQNNFNIMRFLHGILLWNGIFVAERKYYADFDILFPLLNLLEYDFEIITTDITESELYLPYKKYIQLAMYVKTGLYNLKELLHIFNDIFNYDVTEEDILKVGAPAYLIQKVYIEPFRQYINSDNFKQIIKIYTSGGSYGGFINSL